MSRAGGGLKTLCIKTSYSKPNRAESPEGSLTPAESSRLFLGEAILDSDWLTKIRGFSSSILISC